MPASPHPGIPHPDARSRTESDRTSPSVPAARKPRRMAARNAMEWLHIDARLSPLMDTAEQLLRLQTCIQACLPPAMAVSVRVARLADHRLTVLVPHAALATRLRQSEPRLCTALAQDGWQVSAINIRVQPEASRKKSSTSKQALMSDGGLAALRQGLEGIHDPGLAAAFRQILERHGKA